MERHDEFNRVGAAKKRWKCGDRNTKKRTRRDEQMIRAEKTGRRLIKQEERGETKRKKRRKIEEEREREGLRKEEGKKGYEVKAERKQGRKGEKEPSAGLVWTLGVYTTLHCDSISLGVFPA